MHTIIPELPRGEITTFSPNQEICFAAEFVGNTLQSLVHKSDYLGPETRPWAPPETRTAPLAAGPVSLGLGEREYPPRTPSGGERQEHDAGPLRAEAHEQLLVLAHAV